jgi:hypothetical protein
MECFKFITIFLLLLLIIPGTNAYTVNNRSYTEVQKNDPKDRVVVKIGNELSGSSANNFQPILNISRWDETFLSIVPTNIWPGTGTVTLTVNQSASKITASRGNITLNFYNLSKDLPEGGFEYEVVFSNSPINNTLQFTLNTKGLVAYYQPPLNIKNKSCTPTDCISPWGTQTHRLENAVGSYAIYYTKSGDYTKSGGKNYKVGKFGHLYRPFITDKTGKNKSWVDMNITGSTLTLTINQSEIKSFLYPIQLDPTFGTTSAPNESETTIPNAMEFAGWATSTPASSGTLTSISVYCQGAELEPGTNHVVVALYSDNGGLPNNRSAYNTTGQNCPQYPNWGWVEVPISASISASTQYWFGFGTGTGQDEYYNVKYDTVENNEIYLSGNYPFTDPFNMDYGGAPCRQGLYGTYTTGATPPVAIFSVSPIASVRKSTRTITDASTNTPTGWDYFNNPGPNPCFSGNLTTQNPTFGTSYFGWCGPICLNASNSGGSNVNCTATNYLWSSMPWRS